MTEDKFKTDPGMPRPGGFKPASIEQRFGPYRKPTEKTIPLFEAIQKKAFELAFLIETTCPPSQEKSTALTMLQNAKMSANAAIAIYSE